MNIYLASGYTGYTADLDVVIALVILLRRMEGDRPRPRELCWTKGKTIQRKDSKYEEKDWKYSNEEMERGKIKTVLDKRDLI